MELKGKTVLVTGGAKRIGREISLALAKKGAHLLLHYHTSEAEAQTTAKEIKSLGAQCYLLKADLAKTGDLLKIVQEAYRQTKTVDALINSASLFYKTPFKTVQESDWDKLIDTNLKGPFILSKEIGNKMA